jgi:hypothetical protein
MSSYQTPTPAASGPSTSTGLSVLNVIAGIWLIASAFFLVGYRGFPQTIWNSVIVGIVVLILAWIRAAAPRRNLGLSWINALLGIWMIIAPFALVAPPRPPAVVGNDVILGIIILVLGVASALATRRTWHAVPR